MANFLHTNSPTLLPKSMISVYDTHIVTSVREHRITIFNALIIRI